MCLSNDLYWVKKDEHILICWLYKADFWQICLSKSMAILTWLHSKPLYPKKVHLVQWYVLNFVIKEWHQGMKDSYHMSISEWLSLWPCFWGVDYYIWVHAWIYHVTITSNIICGIVDPHGPSLIKMFSCNMNSVPLIVYESPICIALVFLIKQLPKNMIFQLQNEALLILCVGSSMCHSIGLGKHIHL